MTDEIKCPKHTTGGGPCYCGKTPTAVVESLSQRTGDAGFRSPEECLQDCLNDLGKNGAFAKGKKILVIALDDTTGGYGVSWAQAGMKMSECLSLCDVAKQLFLHEMEYNMMPEDLEL